MSKMQSNFQSLNKSDRTSRFFWTWLSCQSCETTKLIRWLSSSLKENKKPTGRSNFWRGKQNGHWNTVSAARWTMIFKTIYKRFKIYRLDRHYVIRNSRTLEPTSHVKFSARKDNISFWSWFQLALPDFDELLVQTRTLHTDVTQSQTNLSWRFQAPVTLKWVCYMIALIPNHSIMTLHWFSKSPLLDCQPKLRHNNFNYLETTAQIVLKRSYIHSLIFRHRNQHC